MRQNRPAMKTDKMRELLAASGKTQADLARFLDVHPAIVNRILKGTRQVKGFEVERIATFLRCSIDDLLTSTEAKMLEGQSPLQKVELPQDAGDRDLPVRGAAVGGANVMFFDNGTVFDWIKRPPALTSVPNAFAVYMVGESMEPRYYAGDTLYIHPSRPARTGCFVLIELPDQQAVIKRFISQDDNRVRVEQFNPAKQFDIPRSQVVGMYRVVGSIEG